MPAKKKLSKEDLERITRAAGLINVEDIAAIWGISKTTLYKYASEELQKGRASTRLFVANKLLDAIKRGNIAATIFFLKTQSGWTETQRIETDVNVQHVISAKPLEDNDWAKKWTGKTIDITEEDDEQNK
jgi:hypothetical protein